MSVKSAPVAKPWIVLLATTIVQSLVAMALLTLPVVAPAVAKDIGISTTYLGAYVGTVYFGAMISSLMGSAAVKKWGAIRLSQAGLFSAAFGLFLCAVPHPVAIMLGALLIGLGYGPITPASSHLLIKTTPADQLAFVFSIKQTGVPLGGMIAGALIPSLATWIGWQWSFIATGLTCALSAWAVQSLRAGLDDDRDPSVKPSLKSSFVSPLRIVLGQRALRLLAVVSFLFAICQMSLMAYLVTYLYEDLGWGLVAAGAALTVAQAAGVGGRILWGFIADRWRGAVVMLMVVTLLLLLATLAIPFVTMDTSLWLLFPILIIFGSTAIGWNGVYLAEVARQAPKGQASLATGGSLCITFLGVVTGPSMFGVLAGALHSYGLSYGFLSVTALIIFIILWALYRRPVVSA